MTGDFLWTSECHARSAGTYG